MNIHAVKLEIVRMILETENESLLESVKNIFQKENKTDFWNSLSAEEKNEIDLGIAEIEKGEFSDYENVMKKHR